MRYLVLEEAAQLDSYDMNAKVFPVRNPFDATSARWFDDASKYQYVITNGDSLKTLKVADEAAARQIESAKDKYPGLHFVFYAFVQASDDSKDYPDFSGQKYVKLQVLKVKLVDGKGHELLTL